jgi:hypothetical protein
MKQSPDDLDELMEQASGLLVQMDYLPAERLCERALAKARQAGKWDYVARILLPLQECRRQRRIIAGEAVVRLGSATLSQKPTEIVGRFPAGAIVLTRPHDRAFALELLAAADSVGGYWEVLLADNPADAKTWNIVSLRSAAFSVTVQPPARVWIDRWITPGNAADFAPDGTTPGTWIVGVTEKLGDAGLAAVNAQHPRPSPEKADALEAALGSVCDHELLIQAYQSVARSLHLTSSSGT